MRAFTLPALLIGLLLAAPSVLASGGGGFQAPGYLPLDPPFVLNVSAPKGVHFMQIKVQAYVETEEAALTVQHHMPAIRNSLIMLFSGRSMEEANTVEAREQWRAEALAEVQHLLEGLSGQPGVSELFFTDFIVQ